MLSLSKPNIYIECGIFTFLFRHLKMTIFLMVLRLVAVYFFFGIISNRMRLITSKVPHQTNSLFFCQLVQNYLQLAAFVLKCISFVHFFCFLYVNWLIFMSLKLLLCALLAHSHTLISVSVFVSSITLVLRNTRPFEIRTFEIRCSNG